MILFVGQVGRGMIEREAFQEIDFRRMFGQMAKWVAEIERCRPHPGAGEPRVPPRDGRAAGAGGAGPARGHAARRRRRWPIPAPLSRASQPHPGPADMERLRPMLARRRRPLVIVGGGGWSAAAVADFTAFAEANELPVGTSLPRPGRVRQHAIRCYVGDVGIGLNPALAERIKQCRSAARRRRAARRDDDRRLHAAGGAAAAADLDPCPSGRGGAGPGLPGRSADQLRHAGRSPRRRARWRRSIRSAWRDGDRGRARRLSRQPRSRRHRPARSDMVAIMRTAAASACPPTPSSPTAPATTPPGCIDFTGTGVTAPSSRRPAAPWAMAFRRRSRPRSSIRSASVVIVHRRRLLSDERAGAGDRRAVRCCTSSSSSSTTACTAPSACTRSATIRAA